MITIDDIHRFEKQVYEITRVIHDNVGILVLRDESRYGFLHLVFQEYFIYWKLLEKDKSEKQKFITDGFDRHEKIQHIGQSLCHHTTDLRFQVPTVLAFAELISSWSQNDFNNLCYEYDSLLPLDACILINCTDDFVNRPLNDVLFNTLDCLIIAAGKLQEFKNIKWLDQTSCSLLQFLSILDNENNIFAIDRLLVKIAFYNHRLLSSSPTTFKDILLDKNTKMNSFPVIILPLITSFYGGSARDGQTIVFNPIKTRMHKTICDANETS
ncbi:unnamed protein product [Rotaria sp. Silwood1]|nr:unnamed protein product [Rotaria sp. Silwood1]